MKTAFLCLIGCLLFSNCFSQSRGDELKSIIVSSAPYPEKIAAYINYNDTFGVQSFDEMLRLSAEGIQLARSKGDSFSIGVLQRHTGEAFYFKGKYDVAASHFYQSIALLEKEPPSKQLARSYNALAKLYRKTRDLSRSLQNYDKAFSIFKQRNDSAGMAMIWNESGVVFEYAKDYKKAIERYNASLQMDRLLKDETGMAYAMGNLAGAYALLGKHKEAENYLLQALEVRRNMRDTFAMALNYSDLSSAYIAASQFEKARRYVDTSNGIAARMGYAELRQHNYDLLANIAEKTGNYQEAYRYQLQKATLRDSIFGIEKTRQIEELNTRYETAQKERQITEQQLRIQRQNTIFVAVAALIFLLALLAYVYYRRYRWKQEARLQAAILRQREEATRAVMEAEEAERQRIAKDLHDGVGQMMSAAKMNLSAYEHNASFADAEAKQTFQKVIQLVDESCTEVRQVSHNMMPNALLKNNLDAALKEFISKLYLKSLNVHLYTEGLDERLDSKIETVLYRVIQECVNNVLKHAAATTLDITVIREEKELTATVEDNGKGFDVGSKLNVAGIGLKNIQTRVEYLKGTVDFDSAPGKGTLVAIHVPL
jgi:signal transduction histidine kinase